MPTYEYRCDNCGHELTVEQRITEPKLTKCPQCAEDKLVRLISGGNFILKGGGWYADLYHKPSGGGAAKSDASSGGSGSGGSSSGGSSSGGSGSGGSSSGGSGTASSGSGGSGAGGSGSGGSGAGGSGSGGSGSGTKS